MSPSASGEAASQSGFWAALAGEPRRWTKRTTGQRYFQAGTASGVSWAVPGVQAAPGLMALTATPSGLSCPASAKVQIRFSSLAWAWAWIPT